MVGREISGDFYRSDWDPSHSGEVVLKAENITFGEIKDFNLNLHKGEILGIGGLSGCGMHDIGRILFGLEKLQKGKVYVNNKKIKNCEEAIENKVGYISKNRDIQRR